MKDPLSAQYLFPGRFTDNRRDIIIREVDGSCYLESKIRILEYYCSKEREGPPINEKS